MRYVQNKAGLLVPDRSVPRYRSPKYQRGFLGSGIAFFSKRASSGDPYWANVVSLLHFNGADGSTTFTDETGKLWTPHGNASISTAQFKFGGSSGFFDGSGDVISSPNSAAWDPGTRDATVEGWVNLVTNANQTFFSHFDLSGGGNGGVSLGTNASGFLKLSQAGIADRLIGNVAVPTGSFQHFAWSRVAGTSRLFIGGVQCGSVSDGSNYASSGSDAAYIGGYTTTATSPMHGYMDEFRFTIGVGRYTVNFTPPTAPFPNHA